MRHRTSTASEEVLEVLKFTYQDDGREYLVRITMFDGEPWFIARDVCAVTGQTMIVTLSGSSSNDQILVEPSSLACAGSDLPISSGEGVWLLSEPRFYEVTSRPNQCWGFKRWVMHEVLPTIRHLNPRSSRRRDLPVTTETTRILDLTKTDGSDAENPDLRIRNRSSSCSLYRFFNSNGRLLYVGISWSVAHRLKEHRTTQAWWHQVQTITIETHSTREAALTAEITAIQNERPRYNIRGRVA